MAAPIHFSDPRGLHEANMKWEEASKLCQEDRRFLALNTAGERKQEFAVWVTQSKKREKEEEREKKKRAKAGCSRGGGPLRACPTPHSSICFVIGVMGWLAVMGVIGRHSSDR